MEMVKSLAYFVLAGGCEICGGYLIWLWLRKDQSVWVGLGGAALLALYGVVPTFQSAHFGRVYAAYGGVFIALAMVWGWKVDGVAPDRFDLIGAVVILIGVGGMMYWPRQ
jgi:small multidrug resistance family-3 protein